MDAIFSMNTLISLVAVIIGAGATYGVLKNRVDNLYSKHTESRADMECLRDEVGAIRQSISELNGTLNQVVGKLDTWIMIGRERGNNERHS